MSICNICGSSFYESGERPHMRCESCRENPGFAEEIKKIIKEVGYVQKKYDLDFDKALEVVKVCSIRRDLDSISYDISHISPY